MPKFKPGDRVVVVLESDDSDYGSGGGYYFKVGQTGTVECYNGSGESLRVNFDDSHGYWAHEDELKLLVPHPVEAMLE